MLKNLLSHCALIRANRWNRCRRLFSLRMIASLLALSGGAAEAAIKIMPLGDSITQGGINGAGSAYASYRYPLFYKLKDGGHDIDFIGSFTALNNGTPNPTLYPNYNTTFDQNHQADWGKKAAYLDANLTAWLNALPAGGKPDIALINIGTNDAAGGTPVTTFTAQLNSIIGKLRASNANVTIVISNLMVIPSYQTAFNQMNTAIANVVATQNTPASRVVIADIASGLPAGSRYDGIHPNAIGEEHLATVYWNALQPFLPTGAVTVDNSQTANVTLTGSWNASTVTPGYYGANYLHDNNSAKGSKAVAFRMPIPADGDYLVMTRWVAEPNRASNVPIDIVSATGTTTVLVNQQLNGSLWNLIGYETFSAATAEVKFRTTGTNGYVVADAVSLLAAEGITVDNSEAARVTTVGTWPASTGTAGFLGANYFHDENTGKGTKSVSFKPALAATDLYLVYARWPAEVNRATNVPIDIVTSNGSVSTVTVNQQLNSNRWVLLGTYNLAPANAEVKFRTTGTNGFVVADGLRVIPVPEG